MRCALPKVAASKTGVVIVGGVTNLSELDQDERKSSTCWYALLTFGQAPSRNEDESIFGQHPFVSLQRPQAVVRLPWRGGPGRTRNFQNTIIQMPKLKGQIEPECPRAEVARPPESYGGQVRWAGGSHYIRNSPSPSYPKRGTSGTRLKPRTTFVTPLAPLILRGGSLARG